MTIMGQRHCDFNACDNLRKILFFLVMNKLFLIPKDEIS